MSRRLAHDPTLSLAACALALCLWLHGLALATAAELSWGDWAQSMRKQHPLAGSIYLPRKPPSMIRVWDLVFPFDFVGTYRRVSDDKGILYRPIPPDGRGIAPFLLDPEILLLGEVHDNPTHHLVRRWLIENMTARKPLVRDGAVVFEQIRTDQQPALDQFKALADAGKGTADALFDLLEWDKSGWPSAAIYKPLMEAVVSARLPILAGDLPRDRVRAVARGGMAAIPAGERARLGLDAPLPAPLAEDLNRELADSHCGALPPQAIPGMVAAQRYRDGSLADAVLRAADQYGSAVLIAGDGHVRSDRGVPW